MGLLRLLIVAVWHLSTVNGKLVKSAQLDPYETPCFGTIGNLYLFGEKCAQGQGVTSQNGRCPCSDQRFTETVVSCINMLVSNETTAANKEMVLNKSLTAFSTKCKKAYSLDTLFKFYQNTSELQPYGFNRGSYKPGAWPVSTAFRPADIEVHDAWLVFKKMRHQENENKRLGAGLLGFWAGVALIKVIWHFSLKFFPLMNHRLHKAATIRLWRASVLLRHPNVSAMSSWQLIVVLAFIVLAIIFTFIDLGVHYPDYSTVYRDSATFGNAIGIRAGVLTLYLLPLLILFAGRNNFLLWVTGWSQDTYLLFHRWIARVAVLELLVHAIGLSINRASRGMYRGAWHQKYWHMGVVGLSFAAFLFVQASRWIRSRAYDVFLVLHICGVIVFLAAGYHHLKLLEEPIGLYFFYACFAVWGSDRALRILRVIYSGFSSPTSRWGLKSSFGVPSVLKLQRDTLVVTFDRPPTWNIVDKPGSFLYIHFLRPTIFWQSHPFTIVPSTEDPNKLKIFVRIHKGITRRLANMIMDNSKTQTTHKMSSGVEEVSYTMHCNVLLDGPYGSSHDLSVYDQLIFVAGGTGITAPFSYIHNNVMRQHCETQKIQLFWAVNNPGLEKWFETELKFLEQHKHIEVHLFISREIENPRKLDVYGELSEALNHIAGPTAILACGPERMNTQAKETVAAHLKTTQHYLNYFEESFSF